jgi:outer membrane receptor protein involved in Fe transport
VPIPISVLGESTLAQQHVFTVADVTQRAPGLTATTPNARRTGVSLRGIGKTSGNDNMEAAVGVIVDDVFLDHVGMTYQDFTDLQQVEILRGPQGTLLGKNTSLGVIKYTSRLPSFTPDGSFEVEAGLENEAWKARGSYSDALIDDLLAFRGSFFIDKQEGDIRNVNPAVGGHWHEQDRWGGRLQLLLEPSDDFSLKLNLDGAQTDEHSNTKPFMVDPATLIDGSVRTTTYTTRLARSYFGGYTPIIGSWDTIDIDEAKPLVTRNYGGSLVATWDVGAFEVKSITAGRWFHFDATNDQEQTRFPISRSGTLVNTEQFSQEFRFTGDVTENHRLPGGPVLPADRDRHQRSQPVRHGCGRVLRDERTICHLEQPRGLGFAASLARPHSQRQQPAPHFQQPGRFRPGELENHRPRDADRRHSLHPRAEDQHLLETNRQRGRLAAGLDRQRDRRCDPCDAAWRPLFDRHRRADRRRRLLVADQPELQGNR